MEWFRWYHGTVTDPKWRVIAKKAGQPIPTVIAVWVAICERASANVPRGELHGLDVESLAAALDVDTEAVAAVLQAMEGRVTHGVTHGNAGTVTAFNKRNPKREDDSRERVRAHRERSKPVAAVDVTQRNAVKRTVTLEESRVKEIEELQENHPSDGKRTQPRKNRTQVPDDFTPADSHVTKAKAGGLDLAVELEAFKNYHGSKGTLFLDVGKGFHTWLGNAVKYAKNGNGRKPAIAAEPILTAGQMRALEARIHA